jgi:hypothetical protein
MRYFRFNLDTAAEYEDMRSAVDGLLGYSPGTTCIQPYASAPADQKGRVVLPLLDFTPGYEDLVLRAVLLVADGKAKELTQDEYDASFFPAPTGGGGGVSSFDDLTDKPTTLSGYGITDAAQAYSRRFAWASPYSYSGRAAAGSATSASVWTIKRSQVSTSGAITATLTATNVSWDNYLTASYS